VPADTKQPDHDLTCSGSAGTERKLHHSSVDLYANTLTGWDPVLDDGDWAGADLRPLACPATPRRV